jgi:hypothetical protein
VLGAALVSGPGTTSAINPAAGATFTDTATCTGGKVVVGGGGSITAGGGATQLAKVAVLSSKAGSTTTWQYTAVVNNNLTSGNTLTVTAQAVCATP